MINGPRVKIKLVHKVLKKGKRQSLKVMNASAICNCDTDPGLTMLKCKIVVNIVILNFCVKLYQNQFT